MAALLEQLLSLARLQGARSKGSVEVDLRNVVRGVVESLLPMAEARRIDLGCVRVEACSVIGDPLDAMVAGPQCGRQTRSSTRRPAVRST